MPLHLQSVPGGHDDGTGDACEDGATPFGDAPRQDREPASPDPRVDAGPRGLSGTAYTVGAGVLVLTAVVLVVLLRRRR